MTLLLSDHYLFRRCAVSVIDDLLALQAKDEQIREWIKNIKEIPERRKSASETRDQYEKQISDLNQGIERAERNIRSIETVIESLRADIARQEDVRSNLSDMKEIAAMGRQIASLQDRLDSEEARLAKARETLEETRSIISETEVLLQNESDRISDELAGYNRDLVAYHDREQAAEKEREGLRDVLDTPEKRRFLSYYERLGKKFFPVLVHVEHSDGNLCCGGCHMRLTASKNQEVQRNALLIDNPVNMKIVTCDYCGRILY